MQYPPRSRLVFAAGAILILNLLDAIFTIVYTHVGVATESNPLMNVVLAASPVAFMVIKLALVSLGVMLLWRLRHRRSAVVGFIVASSAYVSLVIYHLSEVTQLSVERVAL